MLFRVFAATYLNYFPDSKQKIFCMSAALKLSLLLLIVVIPVIVYAQSSAGRSVFISWKDALPVYNALNEIVPAELKNHSADAMPQIWDTWVRKRDAAVRQRLIQGDVDTMVNFLLFGTSFTTQPRLSAEEILRLPQAASESEVTKIFQARLNDLLKGLATPGRNERLLFLQKLVRQQGYNPSTSDGRTKLRDFLHSNWQRVVREQESYQRALEVARLQGGASEEFIERSKLYRERGLSLDTSLLPNFAIEQSLKAMKDRGLLKEQSIRQVAIAGPGLDFADKAGGYDFYPEQTLQPFAVMDSLLRLRLAKPGQLHITALDISPRIHSHLIRLRARSAENFPYIVQLPLPGKINWNPEALEYQEKFGSEIGLPVRPLNPPPGAKDLRLRAISVRPAFARIVRQADVNIVFQKLLPGEQFDLVIATNILVYYDVFEQSLALKNIESMLRPGGFLLSNNALLELPDSKMKSVDYLSTSYSDRDADGDHIVWYRRQVN